MKDDNEFDRFLPMGPKPKDPNRKQKLIDKISKMKDDKHTPDKFTNVSKFPEKNWPEDYDQENGCCQKRCLDCGEIFMGNKHRSFCKECEIPSMRFWERVSKKEPPEDNKCAHAGCWGEGKMVGFAECMVKEVAPLKATIETLQKENEELKENYEGMSRQCKYLTEINVMNMFFDEENSEWKKQHHVKDGERFVDYYMRHHAAEREADRKIIENLRSEIAELREQTTALKQMVSKIDAIKRATWEGACKAQKEACVFKAPLIERHTIAATPLAEYQP